MNRTVGINYDATIALGFRPSSVVAPYDKDSMERLGQCASARPSLSASSRVENAPLEYMVATSS